VIANPYMDTDFICRLLGLLDFKMASLRALREQVEYVRVNREL
jgi:hypothetical protein